MQQKYWSSRNISGPSFDEQLKLTDKLQSHLCDIRNKCKHKIKHCEYHCFKDLPCELDALTSEKNLPLYRKVIKEISELAREVNRDMLHFTRLIVQEAESICGASPCLYSTVALGSLARGEATPYSDLEFMFAVETKEAQSETYFELLAMTVYFLIGNLGETKLKYMAIKELMHWNEAKGRFEGHWFDDAAKSGFKIDGLTAGAGNIPTGNGSLEQRNHFICTVQELASKYKYVLANPDPVESLRGDLSAMLASTALVCGCEQLYAKLTSALAAEQPNGDRHEASFQMMKNDVRKFDLKPDMKFAQTRDVKADIYRYPSLLILDLKIIHRLRNSEPWQIIPELQSRGIISPSTEDCLLFSLCCAIFMRLAAYLHHDSQREAISVLGCDPDDVQYRHIWYVPRPLLLHMFVHLIPLREAVNKHIVDGGVIDATVTQKFKVQSVAIVSFYCQDYNLVVSALKQEYMDTFTASDAYFAEMYVLSLIKTADYVLAEKLLFWPLPWCCDAVSQATSFELLGELWLSKGNYLSAELAERKALDSWTTVFNGKDDELIACCLDHIGYLLQLRKEYNGAYDYLNKALDMRLRLCGDADHESVASSYTSLGSFFHHTFHLKQAHVFHKKALDMMLRLYGDRYHTDVAVGYNNIGIVLKDLGDFTGSYEALKKSFNVSNHIHNFQPHSHTSRSLFNIGLLFHRFMDIESAYVYYKKALHMLIKLSVDDIHPEMARVKSQMITLVAVVLFVSSLFH